MKFLIFLLSLHYIWGAHDDFRLHRTKQEIPHALKLHYENLSSVIESSPNYRWRHLKRTFNYNDYRSHKYLHKRYLPFHHANAYYKGFRSSSKDLNKLRPHPPYLRTLKIIVPYCDDFCQKRKSSSPFLFNGFQKR